MSTEHGHISHRAQSTHIPYDNVDMTNLYFEDTNYHISFSVYGYLVIETVAIFAPWTCKLLRSGDIAPFYPLPLLTEA